MVLRAKFAGLGPPISAAPSPLPSSKIGRKFQPKPTLLSSSGLHPKFLCRSPFFHLGSPTHRLSISAAERRDADYPKPTFEDPATPRNNSPYPKPKYEKSIFLHIWDKSQPPKNRLDPTADSSLQECSQASNVGALNSREPLAEEELPEAMESSNLAEGGDREEEELGEIAVESSKLAGGEKGAKLEFSPQQVSSSRRRVPEQEEMGGTAVECSGLADERWEQQRELSQEEFASSRKQNGAGDGIVFDGVSMSDVQKGQIGAAEGIVSVARVSNEDFTGPEVEDRIGVKEQGKGFYSGSESNLGRGSNVEDRSCAGFREVCEGKELGFMVRFLDEKVEEEEEEEAEDDGSNDTLGDQGIYVEVGEVSPSQIQSHNSELGEFISSANREHLLASTRGHGPSELASIGVKQGYEPNEENSAPTSWNSEIVNPQVDPFSGRGQGLKVGRQVYLTGMQDYKRWMPSSEAESHVQGDSVESQREEEEEVSLLAIEDEDEETSAEKGDKDIHSVNDEEVQLVLDAADTSVGETEPDLLIQFLTKRSELWGGSPRSFRRNPSDRLEANGPKQNGVQLSTEEKLLFTSPEVMTTLDQASQSPTPGTSDGTNPVPSPVIEKILSIVQSLPPNASLETFLTPFCGQISTIEGNSVLKFLGDNRYNRPMLSFFQWMRLHEPRLLDSRSFCTLFTYLGKLKMADQALLQYQNMPDEGEFHCVQVYNSLLGALSKAGRPEKISIILKEMGDRKVERDAVTCGILIAATKGGKERYHKVWTLFDDLLRDGLRPNVAVYGSLIKAFCDEGHLKQALLVSLSMEKMGLSPNVIIYNTLIDAHARAGQLEEAEGLLVELRRRGLHPVESTYNGLINGYGRQGKLDVAEDLLLEMEKEGLKPNVATYTSLISSYGKHLSSEKALNVFLRMKKRGIMPNTQTYTALINAYAEGGWHEKGQRAFDNMLREGLKPTVETYTALLDGYRRSGDLDMVRHLWNTIKEDGCELTKITYRTIMDAFSKHGFYVEARDVMDEFRKRGLEPDTMIYNMLLNAYARGGVCTKLRKVLEEMESAGCEPDPYTYCTLIYTYIRHRDFTSAFVYDSEMQERGLTPGPEIYGKMRFILDSKYALKVENDKKADAGQGAKGPQNGKGKNPQRKKTIFKRYLKKGPRRGSERAKAVWKDKENSSESVSDHKKRHIKFPS